MPFIVREGDTTTSGGLVSNTSSRMILDDQRVALMGDPVWCPACGSAGYIAQGNPTYVDGFVAAATHGHEVRCGCPPGSNRLIASQNTFQADMDAAIDIPEDMITEARRRAEALTRKIKDVRWFPASDAGRQTALSACAADRDGPEADRPRETRASSLTH